jgi:sugar phosphate permease
MRPQSMSGLHYGWVILVLATLVAFGALGLARFGYSIVLPAMQVDLGMDNTQAGVLAAIHVVGYLIASLLGGVLAARYGPRRVIALGLGLAGFSMILTGLADGTTAVGFWRGLAGVGSGMANIPVYGVVSAWFSARRRGLATGIAVSGSSIALIALGPLVPYLLDDFGRTGWRICWYLFGCFTLALAVAGAFLLRNSPADKGLKPIAAENNETAVEEYTNKDLDWSQVYRSTTAWHLGVVYIAFGFSYIIYVTFFFKMLVAEGGYTTIGAGRLFMLMGWCSLLCGLIWGGLSDVVGRRYALLSVYLVQAAAYALVSLWPSNAVFIVSSVMFGITAWSIPGIMAAACGDLFGYRLAPAALGFITVFFGVGQAISPGIAGAMADAAGSFSSAFLLAAIVAVGGAIAALSLPDDRSRTEAKVDSG